MGDKDGDIHYNYTNLTNGRYTFKAYHLDDSYYTYVEKTGEFNYLVNSTIDIDFIGNPILKTPFNVNITGENLTIINITIYDSDNNVVSNIINNNPSDLGTVVEFPGLPVGQYKITAINQGNETVDVSQKSTIFNVSGLNILAADAMYAVGSSMVYQAKLVDDNGNPVSKKLITFTINKNEYSIGTDSKGVAKVTLNLKKGTYDIVISNDLVGNVTKKVNVFLRIVGNKNLVMDYRYGSFKVRAIGDNGKPIANAYVKMNVAGKKLNVKTDKNGYAILKITLKPNTYRITSTYKGYSVKNTIKVKSTLKAKKTFKVKKTRKLILKATLKRSNGKAIAGKKITFKFQGKSYRATTNKKGVAKVTVKNKVIKKLKVGKKYTVKISYKQETTSSKVIVKK